MIACAAPGADDARIITPAFAQRCVGSTEATRATSWPSPVRGLNAYCSASAVPQMSAPPPSSVKTPLDDDDARPATPTTPMSRWLQPEAMVDTFDTVT